MIHFHSGDERFCGSNDQSRQFTLDPCEVTCEACQANDCFVLSPSGEAVLREAELCEALDWALKLIGGCEWGATLNEEEQAGLDKAESALRKARE